jgi:DNA-binding transcriptional MerR regulator
LRWYEDEGLLRPERNGSHRVFSTRDRTRLRLILRGKRLGFSLAEIREIVEMFDAAPGERGQLLILLRRIEEHRNDLGARMHDLQRTLADLDEVEQRARDRLGELASDPD